ncbi:hypothetical protein MWU84_24035, partial [Arenibacter sp. F20364]|nr:hypothetical protein [Arenibacter sp. F20364]
NADPYTLDVAASGITANELADDAVTAAKINSNVAGSGLVQNVATGALEVDGTAITGDGNITSSDLTVGGDANALLGDVTLEIAAGAVGTTELAADAVTNAKLADNAVQTENILNGTILTEDISSGGNDKVMVTDAVGTVAWVDKSSFNAIADQVTITGVGTTLDPFKVEDLSIVTAKLADGAVTTIKLGDDAVTNAKLADDAVQTENILNGTILTEDISSGGNDKVLVTDAVGTVAWVDKSSFDA